MSKSTPKEKNKNEKMIGRDSEIFIETKFHIDPEDALKITKLNYIQLYGLQIIFFVYFIQSLYFGIIHFQYYINNPHKLIFYNKDYIIMFIIYSLFIFGMIKCTGKFCKNCVISILLVILLTLFKIIVIGFLIEMVNYEYFKYSVEPNVYVYWNVIIAFFYMSLIIYNCFKKEYNLSIYFCIGLCYCLIGFLFIFSMYNDKKNSIVFIILTGTEIIYLIGIIHYGIQKSTLVPKNSFWNIVLLDYYKYIILNIILMILLYMFLKFLAALVPQENKDDEKKKEPSIPLYIGPNGEIYDQYLNLIV